MSTASTSPLVPSSALPPGLSSCGSSGREPAAQSLLEIVGDSACAMCCRLSHEYMNQECQRHSTPEPLLPVSADLQTGHAPAAAAASLHALHARPCPHGCSARSCDASATAEHKLHSLLLELLPEAVGTLHEAAEAGTLGVLGPLAASAFCARASCCSSDLHSRQRAPDGQEGAQRMHRPAAERAAFPQSCQQRLCTAHLSSVATTSIVGRSAGVGAQQRCISWTYTSRQLAANLAN